MPTPLRAIPQLSAKIGSKSFVERGPEHYRWMHAEAPVCRAKLTGMSGVLVASYEDCLATLKDPRFVRDPRKAGARFRAPFPMPRLVRVAAFSMIDDDGADHKRLRTLVHKAFTPRALAHLVERVESLTHELLDSMAGQEQVDLMPAYSHPIPVTVIREMLGVNAEEMPKFVRTIRSLSRDFSMWSLLAMLYIDLPRSARLVEEIVERKRQAPADDMLSALVHAEEAGDRLSKDELISMTMLLVVGGFETTVHMITNAVLALLRHPQQLAELRESLASGDELLDAALEELMRYATPVHGTKPLYATEDVVIRGVEVPRGTMIFLCLGAANRDPAVFERPDEFDIHRPRPKHLSLGQGPHFCLGAALARMETKIALRNLLLRFPKLRLAVPDSELQLVPMPLWSRYRALPVIPGPSA